MKLFESFIPVIFSRMKLFSYPVFLPTEQKFFLLICFFKAKFAHRRKFRPDRREEITQDWYFFKAKWTKFVCFGSVSPLLNPAGIRIQEQKENHRQRHHVHIKQQQNPAVIKTPAHLQAAACIVGPVKRKNGRNQQER